MSTNPRIEALEQQIVSLSSALATVALGLAELKEATESAQTGPEENQQPRP